MSIYHTFIDLRLSLQIFGFKIYTICLIWFFSSIIYLTVDDCQWWHLMTVDDIWWQLMSLDDSLWWSGRNWGRLHQIRWHDKSQRCVELPSPVQQWMWAVKGKGMVCRMQMLLLHTIRSAHNLSQGHRTEQLVLHAACTSPALLSTWSAAQPSTPRLHKLHKAPNNKCISSVRP